MHLDPIENREFVMINQSGILLSYISVVCLFQGWDGYRGLPPFPLLPDLHICRDPQSPEFPLHHYSGLGTYISVIYSICVNKFSQKCHYCYALSDQSVPLVIITSLFYVLRIPVSVISTVNILKSLDFKGYT